MAWVRGDDERPTCLGFLSMEHCQPRSHGNECRSLVPQPLQEQVSLAPKSPAALLALIRLLLLLLLVLLLLLLLLLVVVMVQPASQPASQPSTGSSDGVKGRIVECVTEIPDVLPASPDQSGHSDEDDSDDDDYADSVAADGDDDNFEYYEFVALFCTSRCL